MLYDSQCIVHKRKKKLVYEMGAFMYWNSYNTMKITGQIAKKTIYDNFHVMRQKDSKRTMQMRIRMI